MNDHPAYEIQVSPFKIPGDIGSWRTISIRNDGDTPVSRPDVQALGQLDRSDLHAIVAEACDPDMRDAEKAHALFEFMKSNVVKWALPSLDAEQNPIKILNVHGYCNCGGFSITLAVLARAAGLKARNVHLPGHGVTEIWHDGAWHLYDSNLQVTYPKPNGELAGVEEVQNDLTLLDGIDHDFHAPCTFNLEGVREIYAKHQVWHPELPAEDELHSMAFDLLPGETIRWFRDERARFYPHQNEVFMVEPCGDYVAGGTLQIPGQTIRAQREGESFSQRFQRQVPWVIVGGRMYASGFRTPQDGQVQLLLHREETELNVGGILTERTDCEDSFSIVFDFTRALTLPPPAPVLYDLDLELVLFKVRPESELRFDNVRVELDLQRAPQTLPPTDLRDAELVYRDKSNERNVQVVVE